MHAAGLCLRSKSIDNDQQEHLQQYHTFSKSSGPIIFRATLGPKDALYIPPAWIFTELTSHQGMCVGVRVAVAPVKELPRLLELKTLLDVLQIPTNLLKRVIEDLQLSVRVSVCAPSS